MKDNARHDQGSARSLRTPLSRSATPLGRFETSGKSTYKTQTKFRQNRKGDFFKYSAPTTYNFSRVKCLNFPVYPAPDHDPTPNPRAFGDVPASPCLPISALVRLPSRASASLRLCVELSRNRVVDTGQNETFETETARRHRVFRTNRTSILRPVSFCSVPQPLEVGRAVPSAPRPPSFVPFVIFCKNRPGQNEKK